MSTHNSDPGSREFTPTVTVRGEAVLRAEPDEAMLWITLTALEGDPGRALFVVVEGSVEITRATTQGPYVLNTLGPGDAFGELALIDDFPRSATARVATPGRLLILYKSDFDALMEGNARIAVVVMRNLSDADWDRRGIANANTTSARALAFTMLGHERHHLRILRERYLNTAT